MDMKTLVDEMRAYARQHPYNPEDALQGIFVDTGCKRDIEYNGQKMSVIFSYMMMEGPGKCWSLSINRMDNGPVDDKLCEEIARNFFYPVQEAGPVVINPPNPFAPNMRQYGQLARD